jgi:lysophospholipase L1-like esterase
VPELLHLPGTDPSNLPLQRLEGASDVLAGIRQVFRRGDQGGRVRISFYGASHTSSGWWSGHIRRALQDRWGDLGHGFILPAALYRGYRGADVNVCRSEGWLSDYIGKRNSSGDGLLGFAGMSVTSADPADFGWVETTHVNPHGRKVAWFDVYSLGHPGGGSYRVEVDGAMPQVVSTAQAQQGLHITRVAVRDGGHRLKLAPVGDGPVRLFGVSMERPGPGALIDTMGIRGRQARDWLQWDEQLLVEGWRALNPDLVVLAYGTNEANDSNYSMDAYQTDLDAVLSKFRAGLPEVPCILVGPSDRGRKRRGVYSVWDRTAPIAQIQRETAPRYGCAFYDLQAATGGRGSMIAWRFTKPALAASDLIHFTKPGYELIADRFLAALDALENDPRLRR